MNMAPAFKICKILSLTRSINRFYKNVDYILKICNGMLLSASKISRLLPSTFYYLIKIPLLYLLNSKLVKKLLPTSGL